MNYILKSVFIAFILLAVSCRKDKPEETVKPNISVTTAGGVYIVNEGNFQFGNAKISYYDIASAAVTEDIYQPANNVSLGDVCQSMSFFNNKGYIVVNNSAKVMVVNPITFKVIATITGFVSPRYFLPVSNNKAYVTDFVSQKISIVDLNNNTVIGQIPCTGWTEELVLAYGKAFVTNQQRDKVYVINTGTDILEDSIQVSYGSNSIKEDADGKLWVLCGGNSKKSIYAGLHRIDPITNKVEQTFSFSDLTDNPWRLNMNGTNDTIYYLNKSVYQMTITSASLPTAPFIVKGSHNFYGLGIDPKRSIVYVSDAIDYVQRGLVYRYKPDGTLINSFLAGIIPGDFYFN